MKKFKSMVALFIAAALMFAYVPVIEFAALDYEQISLGETKSVQVPSDGGMAYLEFTPVEDGYYLFHSAGEGDPYAYLYDEDMNELAYNDDFLGEYNFQVDYAFTAGEKYIFAIGAYSLEKTFDVTLSVAPEAENIEMSMSYYGAVGDYEQIDLFYTPSYARRQKITWTSDNESIVTISDDGYMFYVGEGETEIHAVSESGFEMYAYVTVVKPLTITENVPLHVEMTGDGIVSAVFTPSEDGTYTFYASDYSNENRAGVSVYDDGMYIASGSRKCSMYLNGGVTYSVQTYYELYYEGSNGGTYNLTVAKSVPAVSVFFSEDNETEGYMFGGITLTAEFAPWNAVAEDITWESDNESVAIIDITFEIMAENGAVNACLINCLSVGKAVITAKTSNGLTASVEVTVKDLESIGPNETKTAEMKKGNHVLFKFTPEEDGCYSFTSSFKNADPKVTLYDTELNLLADDDDGGDNMNFSLKYEYTGGETYIFDVSCWDGQFSGSFDVTLEETVIPKSFEILKKPDKIKYVKDYIGNINLNGLVVEIGWSDGSQKVLTYKDYTFYDENGYATYDYFIASYYDEDEDDSLITLQYGGLEAYFNIEFMDNPVDHLELVKWDRVPLIENCGGHYEEGYNPDTLQFEEFYYYDIAYSSFSTPNNAQIKIVYKDGSDTVSRVGEEVDGNWVEWYDEQYLEPWHLGENYITVSYLGVEMNIPISIISDPVSSINAEYTYKLTEGLNCYDIFNEMTGDIIGQGYYIKQSDIMVRVDYKDGSFIECTADKLFAKTGYEIKITTDQNYNTWGVGKHTAQLSYINHETDFEVEVVANPGADAPASEVKPIPTPVNWKKLQDNPFNVDGDEWYVLDYATLNDEKTLCASVYTCDDEFNYTFYLEFFDETIDNMTFMYTATDIVNKIDTLGENEIVNNMIISPITFDGKDMLCVALILADNYNYDIYRCLFALTEDGTNFTKLAFDGDFSVTGGYSSTPYPEIVLFKDTYIFYSTNSTEYYTTKDFVKWDKHTGPVEVEEDDYLDISMNVFNITDKGVYFSVIGQNERSFSCQSVIGIYFTNDFTNYAPVIERGYPISYYTPKWMYVAQQGALLDNDSFAILEIEYPSDDMMDRLFNATASFYLDAKLMIYNEKTGELKEIYNWDGNFCSFSYWYNLFAPALEMYIKEYGTNISTTIDPSGKVLARYAIPYDIDHIVLQQSLETNDGYYKLVLANRGTNLYITNDNDATCYEVNMPENVAIDGSLSLIFFGDNTILVGDEVYYCSNDELTCEKQDNEKGDFDNDGEITVADALAALRIAAKLVPEDAAYIAIGDVDNDGHVTVADALAILRVAAKLTDRL